MKVNVEIIPHKHPTRLAVSDVVDNPAVYEVWTTDLEEPDYLVVLYGKKYYMSVCTDGDIDFVDINTLNNWEKYGCYFVRTNMNLNVCLI